MNLKSNFTLNGKRYSISKYNPSKRSPVKLSIANSLINQMSTSQLRRINQTLASGQSFNTSTRMSEVEVKQWFIKNLTSQRLQLIELKETNQFSAPQGGKQHDTTTSSTATYTSFPIEASPTASSDLAPHSNSATSPLVQDQELPLDVAAQIESLTQASEEGAAFCEECEASK